MRNWALRVVSNAGALAVAAWLFTGVAVNGDTRTDRILTLLVVALIFGVVNEIVRPVVVFLSLPLYLLTLGLFSFVVNALMLWLTSAVCDALGIGFSVAGFWTAIFAALVISAVCWIIRLALPPARSSRRPRRRPPSRRRH